MTGPNWPSEAAPARGMRYLDPHEGMTPRQVEQVLTELYNEQIRAEISRRELHEVLVDAEVEMRRAEVIATMDPECPKPNRSDITVAQREAWISGMISDEWHGYKLAKRNLEDQDRYLRTLSDNTSKIQTISGHVKQAYSMPQSGQGGWSG